MISQLKNNPFQSVKLRDYTVHFDHSHFKFCTISIVWLTIHNSLIKPFHNHLQ